MIKFVSDGMPHSTQVLNAETGENLGKVLPMTEARIKVDSKGVSAVCDVAMVAFEVTAGVTTIQTLNPVSQKYEAVRAIEFRDGTRVEIADDGTPSIRVCARLLSPSGAPD